MKMPAFALAITIMLFTSCREKAKAQTAPVEPLPQINYQVTRFDTTSIGVFLDVYIADTAQLDALKTMLVNKYKPLNRSFMEIFFFDNLRVASIYNESANAAMSSGPGHITQDSLDVLTSHRVASYVTDTLVREYH